MRLPGIDGKDKMSKSLGNAIFISDSEEELKDKVFKMYTDPLHINIDDPGHIEGNIVFTYLDAFSTDEDFNKYLNEYKNLDELKAKYQQGGVGDMVIKKFLFNILNDLLTPIRDKRNALKKDLSKLMDILIEGNKIANEVANETLNDVKNAMGINYFNDKNFVKEQEERLN